MVGNVLTIEFITVILRFSVPHEQNGQPNSRNGFCAGGVGSLIELQAVSDGVRLLGSFLYPTSLHHHYHRLSTTNDFSLTEIAIRQL